GHRIDALAELLGHEKATAHSPQERRKVIVTMRDDEVVAPARVPGRGKAELACGIAAEKVATKHPVTDDVAGFRRHAFVVERRTAAAARKMRFLANRNPWGEHQRSQRIRKERRLAIQRPAGDSA